MYGSLRYCYRIRKPRTEYFVAETVEAEDEKNPFRVARVRAGLTQTQVASRLGVRPATVVAWEQGTQPQPATLERIAELYGVDAAELRQPTPRSEASDRSARLMVGANGESITIDPVTFGRIYERLVMTAEMVELLDGQQAAMSKTVHGIGDSLESTRAMLAKLAGGVQTAIGQLPHPPTAAITVEQAEADAEAIRRERAYGVRAATSAESA